jgi:hypothetical protein
MIIDFKFQTEDIKLMAKELLVILKRDGSSMVIPECSKIPL